MMEYGKRVRAIEEQIDSIGPWFWPATDVGCWNIIKSEWPHLKQMWGKHVKKYDVCIQAGGACGMYPRLLAETFKEIYTFEPDPLSFHCLVLNCQLDNVYKYHAAIGDSHDIVKLHRKNLQNVGENVISDKGDYSVPTLMVDDLGLRTCDFIQLDVETYELNALKGAHLTIKRCNPVISVENGNDDILKFLQTLGFYKHVDSFAVASDRSDDVYAVV